MAFSCASREHGGIPCCFIHCTHVHVLFPPDSKQTDGPMVEREPAEGFTRYLFVNMLGFECHTWWNLQVGTC